MAFHDRLINSSIEMHSIHYGCTCVVPLAPTASSNPTDKPQERPRRRCSVPLGNAAFRRGGSQQKLITFATGCAGLAVDLMHAHM